LEKVENDVRNPLYQLAEGGWFKGEEALKLGLIDAIGDLIDALRLASGLAGIEFEKAEVVSIMPPPPGTFGSMFYETPVYRDNTTLPIFLK
jgi:ClpP class serine protease